MVKTYDDLNLGDNIDLYIRRGSPPDFDNWDFTSVRESNPWAIDIFSEEFKNKANCTAVGCETYYIGVMGDNQFPQKSGASQYRLKAWLGSFRHPVVEHFFVFLSYLSLFFF